ncbi:MAG: J domain-containing protein [Pseudomonadota bacterium]
MSDETYKPRLGFDIRVKPPRKGKGRDKTPTWAKASTRICEREGCEEKAVVCLAESPRDPTTRVWLCATHAAEHNKNWNYFDGMSKAEAEQAKEASMHGDRPTWTMGKNDRARAAAQTRGVEDMADTHKLFKGADAAPTRTAARSGYRDGRKLPRLQVKAFETLDLKVTAPAGDIRKRYAELVRRFHPDSNGGDRSAETQLQQVVRAHQILKKAGIC